MSYADPSEHDPPFLHGFVVQSIPTNEANMMDEGTTITYMWVGGKLYRDLRQLNFISNS